MHTEPPQSGCLRGRLRLYPLLLLACAGFAHAAAVDPVQFEQRVRLAQAAQREAPSKIYPHMLFRRAGRHVARTMRRCIAASPPPQAKAFVLVADITAQGRAAAVEVLPDSAVARCFAAGFAAAAYPRPPAFAARDGFPVTLKVRVAP